MELETDRDAQSHTHKKLILLDSIQLLLKLKLKQSLKQQLTKKQIATITPIKT